MGQAHSDRQLLEPPSSNKHEEKSAPLTEILFTVTQVAVSKEQGLTSTAVCKKKRTNDEQFQQLRPTSQNVDDHGDRWLNKLSHLADWK